MAAAFEAKRASAPAPIARRWICRASASRILPARFGRGMKFVSTRGGSPECFDRRGDPQWRSARWRVVRAGRAGSGRSRRCYRYESLAELGAQLLAPFFDGDPLGATSAGDLRRGVRFSGARGHARRRARSTLRLLELFHGPTGAFKDFGARFLMACFDRLGGNEGGLLTSLAATSGDTPAAPGRPRAAEGRSGVRGDHPLPARPGVGLPAASALLLGRAGRGAGGGWRFRRLPAPGVKAAFADPVLSAAHQN